MMRPSAAPLLACALAAATLAPDALGAQTQTSYSLDVDLSGALIRVAGVSAGLITDDGSSLRVYGQRRFTSARPNWEGGTATDRGGLWELELGGRIPLDESKLGYLRLGGNTSAMWRAEGGELRNCPLFFGNCDTVRYPRQTAQYVGLSGAVIFYIAPKLYLDFSGGLDGRLFASNDTYLPGRRLHVRALAGWHFGRTRPPAPPPLRPYLLISNT